MFYELAEVEEPSNNL